MDYSLASLFVLGVLLFYNVIRECLPMRKNMTFNYLLISVAAADVLQIISFYAGSSRESLSDPIVYVAVLPYYIVVLMVPVVFGYLVVSLTGQRGIKERRTRLLITLVFIIEEFIMLTIPFEDIISSFDHNNSNGVCTGFFAINLLSLCLLLWSCIYILSDTGKTKVLEKRAICLFFVITLITSILEETVLNSHTFICAGFTLAILIMFIAVQNPDSYRDHKTGIFSVESLRELEDELISENTAYSLLAFSFANYKVVRNTYGDEIMKPCLRDMAEFLSKEVCSRDVFPFYIHNGRFELLKKGFYDFSKEKAAIDSRFLNPWKVAGADFQFSPSYAYVSSDIEVSGVHEADALIDMSIKEALDSGAFSFVSVDEEFLYEIKHDSRVKLALDRAIEKDELEVWFQPIWCPSLNRINSAEALVRIRDPELGIIYPDEFIKIAEGNGSIIELGQQVYRKVCEFISTHDIRKMGLDYLEVNLSPIQCLDEHMADDFIKLRESYGIDPGLINLEITETAASDSSIAMENMLRLSRDGIRFSLDDYGTGFSNLMNMLSLPLSIIKIDKSIVWSYFDRTFALSAAAGGEEISVTEEDREYNILSDLIPMFQSRGLKVVCEGVETYEMVRVLEEMGCDYMQGFFFSKPVPSEDFIEFIKAKNRR